MMKTLIDGLIGWPERTARHLEWLAPLFARIVVGWVFLWSGWGKLSNLPATTENFVSWGIPLPPILAPFVSGVEFFGGILLLLGLLTRISAGALGVTMIVAITSAKWDQVDSLETLLGFDETEYLALFLWLAIAGAGRFSIDRLLNRSPDRPGERRPKRTEVHHLNQSVQFSTATNEQFSAAVDSGVAPYSSQAVSVKHFAPKGLGDGRSADVTTIALSV